MAISAIQTSPLPQQSEAKEPQICLVAASLECWLKRKPYLDLTVAERRNGHRIQPRGVTYDAFVPRRDLVFKIESLHVAPIGCNKVAEPLVQMPKVYFVEQLQAKLCRLEFVIVQNLQKVVFVCRVLQGVELIFQGRRDPLHGMAEQVQQDEALHFEFDVRIDHDPQAIEDACPRWFQVAILDAETVLDDTRRDSQPQLDACLGRQLTYERRLLPTLPDEIVPFARSSGEDSWH